MGYIHDVNSYQVLPPSLAMGINGTWSFTTFDGAKAYRRSGSAGSATLAIPLILPSNSVSQRGAYIKSIDIWYKILTAAMTAFSADLVKYNFPENGLSFSSVDTEAFTYDSGHNIEAERITVASHKMTLTIDTPFWLDTSSYWIVELDFTDPGTSVFYYYGSLISYTWRL